MQNGIGRHHVGTAQTQGDAVGIHCLHLTATFGGLTFGQKITINDSIADADHRGTGRGEGGRVLGALDDQTTNRVGLGRLRQLSRTGLLAQDLGGGDHITGLHRSTIFDLQLSVGGSMAGVGHGVATHQNRLEDHQSQP